MNRRLQIVAIALSEMLCLASFVVAVEVEGKLKPFLGKSQLEMKPLFSGGRFPNIAVTMKGTLLASWWKGGVLVRRSEDGGKTWGKQITIAAGLQGGGMTVDEKTGNILAFVEDRHPPAPLKMYRSKDDGKTWQTEKIKIYPDSKGNMPSMHMNEHGITLRHGKHKGRLVRPSRYYGKRNAPSEWHTHYTNAIYSDDGGRTWRTSDPFPEKGTGEATVAELSNGQIYYNSRVHWQERPKNRRRRSAMSFDGAKTWKNWRIIDVLPDGPQDTNYGCMGGLVRLPIKGKDILIYSNCDSPSKRKLGTVWASFDGGKSWPIQRLVHAGRFAYSSLNAGRPGTPGEGWIYCHFEGRPNKSATVAKFNLTWILGGKPTNDGSLPKQLK